MDSRIPAVHRRLGPGLVLLLGAGLGSARAACPLSGQGTEKSPYLVGTVADLQQISASCGDSAVFRLTSDLDATGYSFPISAIPASGDPSTPGFRGRFHGAGHAIRNLSVQAPPSGSPRYSGLFWQLEPSAVVDSLGLPNTQIHGFRMGLIWCNTGCSTLLQVPNGVGGITGHNLGTIRDCFVTGRFFYLGDSSYTLSSTMSRTFGPGIAGGIAGVNAGTIANSYAILNGDNSLLTSSTETFTRFAPIALRQGGAILNCYWAVRSPAAVAYGYLGSPDTATSLTLDQMKHAANFHGFGFAKDSAWTIVEGSSFPLLRGLANAEEATNATVSVFGRSSSAVGSRLLVRDGQLLLRLDRPAQVRIVGIAGRILAPDRRMEAGIHPVGHPTTAGAFLVQVRDDQGTTTHSCTPSR